VRVCERVVGEGFGTRFAARKSMVVLLLTLGVLAPKHRTAAQSMKTTDHQKKSLLARCCCLRLVALCCCSYSAVLRLPSSCLGAAIGDNQLPSS
jgi:hypothetical protein